MLHRLTTTVALLGASALPAQFAGISSVYALTNDKADNAVQVGVRVFGWMLPFGTYSTGGTGTAAGLGSQGSLTASRDGRHLLAVNPGSGDLTVFRRFGIFLLRSDVESTGGESPTSVDIHGDLVYALNAGSDEVAGFSIRHGNLRPLGRVPLSGTGVGAAQVGFDPRGRHLVVTERATNQILVFPVQRDGSLGKPTVNKSAGMTPFGFVFRDDGVLVVSEAAGGQAGASVVSSYAIGAKGVLRTISSAVPTNQSAACWIAIPRNGRFAYSTNTGSASITGFAADRRGSLARLDRSGVTGSLRENAAPIDFDFDHSGRTLFVLDSAHDEIVTFWRDHRGGLHRLSGSLSLPDGAAGVLAR